MSSSVGAVSNCEKALRVLLEREGKAALTEACRNILGKDDNRQLCLAEVDIENVRNII